MNKIAIPPRNSLKSLVSLRRIKIRSFARICLYPALLGCLCLSGGYLMAQDTAGSPSVAQPAATKDSQQSDSNDADAAQQPTTKLPNSQEPKQSPQDQRPFQTKRILGVIPNFRAVSTSSRLPAQSVKEKFITCTQDSFDYSSIFIPAALAGYSMGTGATPEFGGGAAGYGRYFWHAAVDQTSENYLVEFFAPVLTHEDTRFYTLEDGSILKRAEYALSRAVVTRSDSGNEVFNFSEVVGAGAAAGISNLYYPRQERTFANTGKQWGIDVGIDGASMLVKEFWPDINHHLFHGRE